MNINPLIEQAFAGFTVQGRQIPIFYMHYAGKADEYLTYYTWYEHAELFADNDFKVSVVSATIDVWSKGNFKPVVEAVKQVLRANHFMWTENGPEDYEADTEYYHVPINFYYDGP
jgi:hypothetical protein